MARRSMADLAVEPTMAATVPTLGDPPPRLRQVPVASVAPNPLNPPSRGDDLSDLASMKTSGQLQPCTVATRAAFIAVYPEHATAVGACEYVVIAGTRRRLAAEQLELATLDVIVRDTFAANRVEFLSTTLRENIDRQDLKPLDEALALKQLADECGHGGVTKAAAILGRSKGFVSQRIALLGLTPAMKDYLRSGELNVSDARDFGKMDPELQEPAWRKRQAETAARRADSKRQPVPSPLPEPTSTVEPPPWPPAAVHSVNSDGPAAPALPRGTGAKLDEPRQTLSADELIAQASPESITLKGITFDGGPLYGPVEKTRRQLGDDLTRQYGQALLDSVS
jgi:ParB family chromosome partitioning protein